MNIRKAAILALTALVIAAFAACSNGGEKESSPESLPQPSQTDGSASLESGDSEKVAEEVGYMTLAEITAEGYYPLWMQPNTYIVYDENCVPEITEGGELLPEDLVGRDDIASVGFSPVGDSELKIEPNTKAEYDLHGFIQNIYHKWPDGSYNLDYRPESEQQNP